jgi:hypothetical protein
MTRRRPRVAFLFLGETLLIPHLYPIAEALARRGDAVAIDLWVSTSVHEALIAGWLRAEGLAERARIRRAPGYRTIAGCAPGTNPPAGFKPLMLARIVPRLLGADVVVCAEQTSLWIPRILNRFPARFVMNQHGAGSVANRGDRRRDAAWRLLVPSAFEADELVRHGRDPARIEVVGYVKAAFRRHAAQAAALFAQRRPVIAYIPHWQRHRSSWWEWGRAVVGMLAAQQQFNVVIAPHQRLVEKDPDLRTVLESVAHLPHVHVDWQSFAMGDGSYTAMADLYLGDTSSQVCEFLVRPRPCVFLDAQGIDWRATDDHGFWECGEVVDTLETLPAALDRAMARHADYAPVQRAFVERVVGLYDSRAADRAADAVLAALT